MMCTDTNLDRNWLKKKKFDEATIATICIN